MGQNLSLVTLVVRDYDEAIEFYVGTLGFELVSDVYQPEQDKRWVVVRPKGSSAGLLLGRAEDPAQVERIGSQAGGRVAFFLETDDFWRDFQVYRDAGVKFVREPIDAEYGTVAVFHDLYGNPWDLIQYRDG